MSYLQLHQLLHKRVIPELTLEEMVEVTLRLDEAEPVFNMQNPDKILNHLVHVNMYKDSYDIYLFEWKI